MTTTNYLSGYAFAKKVGNKIHVFEPNAGVADNLPVTADGSDTPRALKKRFSDVVNVKDFGAVGDGVHDDTDAIQTACGFAKGKLVFIPAGVYKATDRIVVPESCSGIVGEGVSQWDLPSSGKAFKWDTGTTILFSGTPSHFHYVKGVTSQALTGGSPNNPDDASEVYELLDYTNQDAVSSKATYKALKCGVVIESHSNVILRDFRVMVSCRGIDGYNLIDTKNLDDRILGDDYDIGLLINNCSFVRCQNVQVVGYWRMAGLAHVNSEEGKNFSEATYNTFRNCYFQGLVGVSIRATDALPVISYTENSVTVPFSPSNLLGTGAGTVFLGTAEWEYTSTSVVDDTITLTGDAFPENATFTEVRLNLPNFGVAGTAFYDCVITGLAHSSRCRAKDLLGKLGCAVEVSGFPLRDVDFYNCHFFDSECVIHLHDCEDISLNGCFAEHLGARDASHNWIAVGARFIVNGAADAVSNFGKYPLAGCTNLVIDAASELAATVDRHPVYRNAALTRFTSDTGLYRPAHCVDLVQKLGIPVLSGSAWNAAATLRTNGRGLRVVDKDYRVKLMVSENGSVSVNSNTIPASTFPLSVNGLYETVTPNDDVVLKGMSTGIQFRSTGSNDLWRRIASYGGTWRFMQSTGQNSSYATCFFIDASSIAFSLNVRPETDAERSLGLASRRWSQVYAATDAINTSDEREKASIVAPDESLMRAWGKVNFRVFQFKDAVDKKGSEARLHVGVIAQEVIEAFASEGLDATRYGLLCHDEWEDEYEDVEVIDEPESTDADGNVIPAKTHIEHRLITPAGDRYGIRYGEALALECAYQRWRLDRLEK